MSLFSSLEIAADKPYRVLLNDLDGNPLRDKDGAQAWVDVISTDSDTSERLSKARRDKLMSGKKTTADAQDQFGVELLAQLTTGWYLVGFDGNPIAAPFSTENAKALYSNPKTAFITEQVRAGAATRGNFTPSPASN